MSKSNEQKVLELMRTATGLDAADENKRFQDIPGWDSLRHAEFIISLQREFKVRLSPSEIAALVNLRAAFRIIQDRVRP